jgi:NAD(P)-dependent dehydrogenase (short-subunit alcohol dehydrogenase family)
MRSLNGKVAVVTGAASGIGWALSDALVAEGMRVVLADLSASALAEHADQLGADGGDVIAVVTDVRDRTAVDALANATLESFATVHLVCNIAGIIGPFANCWEISDAVWDQVLAVNLKGPLNMMRAFVPLLLTNGSEGHVVNMSSMAGATVNGRLAQYDVSKHGMTALSETLGLDLASVTDSVNVTTVFPGLVTTPMSRQSLGAESGRPGALKPEVVAAKIVDAVKVKAPFLFTHPDRVQDVRDRWARIVGDAP